jgi:predicted small lipoprotein YifL
MAVHGMAVKAETAGRTRQRALGLAVIAVLVATLAGCGVRGSLENPNKATGSNKTATADSGQGKPEGAAPKPHKEFILDGLIR